jgi:TldD protein
MKSSLLRPTAVLIAIFFAALRLPLHAAPLDDPLLRAMQEELERSKAKLKLDNVAAPYYVEYRVTDLDVYDASARFGALIADQRGRSRFLRVVVRIGDYKQDSYYGSGEGTVDIVPLDDDVYAIRHRLWLATDRAYKAAGEALAAKQSALKQMTIDQPVDDFTPGSAGEVIKPLVRLSAADFSPYLHLLAQSSDLYRTDPLVQNLESSLHFVAQNTYYVNSEGMIARTGITNYAVSIAGATQAPDGQWLQRSHQDDAIDLSGLPAREQFLETSTRLVETLKLLRDAPLVDEEYRGPVLFSNDAACTVMNDLVQPNVLGRKPRLGENGRTTGFWSSSYKERVLPSFVDVIDDPTISSLAGDPLIGHYVLDDEGVRPQRVSLIENGKLVSYLTGRQPIRNLPASNGHARGPATADPGAFPGNLILTSTDPQPDASLKNKLIEMAKQRGLPYAVYVETMGPRLDPRLMYRVYVNDGHQELVRGAVFGDLDVRSLRSELIAAGNAPDVEDHIESVPYSIVSPALLFDELQVKRTPASKQTLPEYPAPALTDVAHR